MSAVLTVPTSMKGYICSRPVSISALQLSEIPLPVVADDDVLIRVRASSANPVDLFPITWAGYLMGGRKPTVLGTDFAGVVESVGSSVTSFRPGDEVFGGGNGAFAEYMRVRASRALARKPAGVSFEEAGTVAVAGCTALQALRNHGGLRSGQRVLINGASGGVGTFAVQIARALGADVTAVCSTRNVEMVRSLGAAQVIDYTRADFTRSEERYDLMIDVAGNRSLRECRRVLAPGATFVGTGAAGVQHRPAGSLLALRHFLGTRVGSIGSGLRVVSLFIASLVAEDMAFLGELLASGRVKPVIDRRYQMGEVPAALEYLNAGHARAKVAIAIG